MAGKNVDLEAVRHQVAVLKYIKEERSRLSELEAESRDIIQDLLGDKEFGVLDRKPVVSYIRSPRRAVSVPLLREKYPEIAEECMVETEIRSFRVLDND